jgi:hypothetical protein
MFAYDLGIIYWSDVMRSTSQAMLLSLLALSVPAAHAYTIDGNLSDWGVKRTGQESDWTPNAGVYHTIEDQETSFLSPGWGGQAYDAEALYVDLVGNTLYIAMATGHNPNTLNSGNNYGAGDFAIDFGRNGSFEVGINVKPGWDTFGESGGVYKVDEWHYGIWDSNGNQTNPTSSNYNPNLLHPTSIKSGDWLGQSQLFYTTKETTTAAQRKGYGEWAQHEHYFYEIALDTQLLRDAGWMGESFDVHWTMNCANDAISADPPGSVPEPGTLALMLLGLTGVMSLRLRKKA